MAEPAPKRFLHIMGAVPIMLVQEIPPEFSLDILLTQIRANQYFFDGAGVYLPYHAIQCIMVTTGQAPPAVPGYPMTEGDNIVPFKGKPN